MWRDDGNDGDFVNLFYTDTILGSTYTDNNVIKSEKYRYKYRARNINGWGPFSNPSYLLAADTPSQPKAPLLLIVSHDLIKLQFFSSSDEGGSPVTSYELFMDQGDVNTPFAIVNGYSTAGGNQASLLQYSLTEAIDGIQNG